MGWVEGFFSPTHHGRIEKNKNLTQPNPSQGSNSLELGWTYGLVFNF